MVADCSYAAAKVMDYEVKEGELIVNNIQEQKQCNNQHSPHVHGGMLLMEN